MKNTRERILKILAVTRQATVNKLSVQLGINPITIRHNLLVLKEEELIVADEKRHGVGRPHLVYRLSNKGVLEITSNYRSLSESLLSKIELSYGANQLTLILETIGHEMAKESFLASNPNLSEWMDSFCDLMAEQGYQVDWAIKEDRVYIRNASCPFYYLKQTHQAVCSLDHAFFSTILAKELRIETDINAEKPACIYSYEVKHD